MRVPLQVTEALHATDVEPQEKQELMDIVKARIQVGNITAITKQ